MARQSWLDEKSKAPLIDQYVKQLGPFMDAMADGVIDEKELSAQEQRLVAVMKEVEPLLNDELHTKVTKLICELSAYDLMQVLHGFQAARPATKFVG